MTTIQPVAKPSLGAKLDQDIAGLHARLLLLEGDAKKGTGQAIAWVKDKWPHFVTWLALAAPIIAKHL